MTISKPRQNLTRRSLLGRGAATLTVGTALTLPLARALGATPSQIEGPYHPVNLDIDLTRKSPSSPRARGQIIVVQGKIIDDVTRRPLAGVLVELWQADAQGLYDHPADPSQGNRDPNFQFWGRTTTDAQGNYTFKTIKPGSYPAADGWDRPPHLHFRFMRRGYHELTTQMYFSDETVLNQRDRLLQALTPENRRKLVVSFHPHADLEPDSLLGRFDIELAPVR